MNNYYIHRFATIEGYKQLFMALEAKVVAISKHIKKTAKDDPRRVIHSFKVGLALTLVSLFYYFNLLYNNFGSSAMWAIMTVVVVFEYSVGATLGKGLNRALATFLASGLGVGAHYLASITTNIGEPILLGIFVFLLASTSTFVRFFPTVKTRYDYGLVIFILTFSMVTISGYRTDEILDLAQKRLTTIAIGASICVIISIVVYPVWAGEDLHKLVAQNIEKLGHFVEGFSDKYFETLEGEGSEHHNLASYRSVLDSKNNEEALANFARWEPGHGSFLYGHPWNQYLIIGSITRQCVSRMEAINVYNNSQAPQEMQGRIQETLSRMSKECGKALKELSMAVKTMSKPSSSKQHIKNSRTASKGLQILLNSEIWGEDGIIVVQIIHVASVASIMMDVVDYVENIYEAIEELASLANFENRSVTKPKLECSCSDDTIVNVQELTVVVGEDCSTGKGARGIFN